MTMINAGKKKFSCRNAMHNLRPAKAASFSFAWIEIISHRVFIGKMLALNRNHKVMLIFVLIFTCHADFILFF